MRLDETPSLFITRQILLSREGNNIMRNHATYTNARDYTVAKHSCALAQLLFILFPEEAYTKPDLVKACLFHDSGSEFATGDIVGYAKKRWQTLKDAVDEIEEEINEDIQLVPNLEPADEQILKLLDSMELYLFSIEEKMTGCKLGRFMRMHNSAKERFEHIARGIGRFDLINIVHQYEVMLGEAIVHY